jgi:hypothetical protein
MYAGFSPTEVGSVYGISTNEMKAVLDDLRKEIGASKKTGELAESMSPASKSTSTRRVSVSEKTVLRMIRGGELSAFPVGDSLASMLKRSRTGSTRGGRNESEESSP